MGIDRAPIGHTCPIIDDIINHLEDVKDWITYIIKNPKEDTIHEYNTIVENVNIALENLEKVRDANSELRQWGNDEYERAEQAESIQDDVLRDKEDLQEEIDQLQAKVSDLEDVLLSILDEGNNKIIRTKEYGVKGASKEIKKAGRVNTIWPCC